ncbi:IS3 family transposase [Nicoliella lavandulae]|uniref:IS3 family transposase n=1 Tax=Nicoliella lavandulae TaxID=3082954 RepID=UPI0035A01C0D
MPKSYSKELRDSIIALAKQGRSITSLAKDYNISTNTINRWIKQAKTINVDGKSISYEKYIQMENKLAETQEELEILKRAAVLLGKPLTINEALGFIKDSLEHGHRLATILRAFKMPKSTYYYWTNHQPTKRDHHNLILKREILVAWQQSRYVYGYPRIHQVLLNKGLQVSSRTVWKLMHSMKIHSVMNKKYRKPTTHNDYEQRANLVRQDWRSAWCADITYIPLTNHKWVYLASVYNPNNHKVIAHQVCNEMTAELVTNTMLKAVKKTSKPMFLHSDMGSQYTSDLFEKLLNKLNIKHSYSLKGHPYDNTYIENFHSMLKRELVFQTKFESIEEAIAGIDWYVRWYNNERISLVKTT